MTCRACGRATKVVIWSEAADTLICRVCKDLESPTTAATAIRADDIPGGVTVENYGPKPMTFYSHTERRAYMEAHGLREKEKFCPMPGTDKDPQGIPNPAGYIDEYTLRGKMELLARNGRAESFDGVKSGVLRNLTVHVGEDGEAIRATENR